MKRDAPTEAEKLRAEIAEARAKVKALTHQIRNREGRLRRIAADAFNELSEPIDGMTAEVREILLGERACEASPIGICVYSRLGYVLSIPGQLEIADWHAKHGHAYWSDIEKWSPATKTDACLFCGTTGTP